MPHIVCSTLAHTSRLNTSFELTRRLVKNGHTVTYVCPEYARRAVTEQGYPFVGFACSGAVDDDADYLALEKRRFRQKLFCLPKTLRMRRAIQQRFVENDEIRKTLKKLNPDLLLIDLEMHLFIIATRNLGIPTVLFLSMFSIWKRPGLPPLHFKAIPDRSRRSRLVAEGLWLQWRIEKNLTALRRRFLSFGTDQGSLLTTLALHHGFSIRRDLDKNQWLVPFSYRHLPVLVTNAMEMEFPHDPPDHVFYVGPMIFKSRSETRVDNGLNPTVNDLITGRKMNPDQIRPLIYCSLSTFRKTDPHFLSVLIKVFQQQPDWELIIGLGNKLNVEEIEPLPRNIHTFQFVPQLDVLRYADCVITHGGTATINECVFSKIPMLVYSTETMDHNGNAARVAYHGLGIMGDKDRDTVDDITRNIQKLLADSSFKLNIERMQRHFLEYDKVDKAVQLIEKFIN